MRELVVLGSAQDGGLPQLGADHPNDRRARAAEIPSRTAASAAVVTGHGTLLIDASPDIRQQAAQLGSIDAIALTHAHMGHYAGLVQFGREAADRHQLPVYCTRSMADYLAANAPWRSLVENANIELRPTPPGTPVGVFDDLAIELILVPHRPEHSDAVAISVAGTLLYLPDIDRWEDWPDAEEVLARHAVAIVDATFYSPDELAGRSQAEVPHPPVVDTVDRFGHLDTRMILTHLNHTNPLVVPGARERTTVAEAGFEVAEDGMRLVF